MNGPNDLPPKPSFGPEEEERPAWGDLGWSDKLGVLCIVALLMFFEFGARPWRLPKELYRGAKLAWLMIRQRA